MPPSTKSVALIGSYVPRQCGIATFTADLAAAILEKQGYDCRTLKESFDQLVEAGFKPAGDGKPATPKD